ncbi:MAG: PQQ-binding-like beta-propeller repeat protein [Candidatus Bathyarchaeia archaeon]
MNAKSKSTTFVTLFLLLTVTLLLIALPIATAHDPPYQIVSYAYIHAAPNPVGVGQRVSIIMWIDYPMPAATVTNDVRRTNYKLTITKPDGKTETFDWPIVYDSTSVQYFTYMPDQVGTYTLKFDYPGQVYTWNATAAMQTWTNDVFLPASKTTKLTVQQEPVPDPVASYPLPTEYWTRPIEGQNTDWWMISSNWLGPPYIMRQQGTSAWHGGHFQPDGIAPNSPHIMWSKPIQDGGVVGGSSYHVQGTTYYMGGSYNTRWSNQIVMHGRLYYQLPYGNSGGGGGWMCVDLRTGKEIWYNDQMGVSGTGIPSPAFGYLFDYDMYNQHGVIPNGWLFSTNFGMAFDPATGKPAALNLTNVPTVPTLASVPGPYGEMLRYQFSSTGKWLAQWNSSKVFNVQTSGVIPANAPITPAPSGTNTYWNGSMWVSNTVRTAQGYAAVTTPAYDWNVTIPSLGPGTWTVNRASLDNILLLTQGNLGVHVGSFLGSAGNWEGMNITAISLKPESRGQILWTKYYPPAPGNKTRLITSWDPENGVFIMTDAETMDLYGYSLANGNLLWGPTAPAGDLDFFRQATTVAYGKLYYAGYGGILYCYDVKTGNLLWTYGNGGLGNSTYAGTGTAWGHYPIFVDVIADGKVYLATTEHSPGSPFYKGTRYRCVNATNGKEIWTIMGWGTGMDPTYDIVADGFFVFLNCYDMKIYCVGKGPSATSVSIQNDVVTHGSKVLVKGSVIDIAAGTKQDEQAARFPNGVPAVADESMSAWMEYVYMQKPRPADVKGVEVIISVLDPNGNYYEVGRTVTDADGFFKTTFEPPVPGEYTVITEFKGSESYWPSHAKTALFVEEAPPPTPPPTATPVPLSEQYFLPMSIGMIAAIIVIIILLVLLLLRKR